MGYSNIIFDLDGTLSDSKHDIAGAQLWVLNQLGITHVQPHHLFPFIGRKLEETFEYILPVELHHRIPEAAKMYVEYYVPRSLATTVPFPGVRETLAALAANGKVMAIGSTKKSPQIRRVTDHFGITGFFVQLQGSEELPAKPDPSILNKIIADQGWNLSATLMVGDTDYDVLAGQRAGIATCGVTYGSLSESDLRAFSPDHLIGDFPSLLSIV